MIHWVGSLSRGLSPDRAVPFQALPESGALAKVSWLLALAAACAAVMLLRSVAARARLAADKANCACSAGLGNTPCPVWLAPTVLAPVACAKAAGDKSVPKSAAMAGV